MNTLIRLFFICAIVLLGFWVWAESNPPGPAKQEPPAKIQTVDVEKAFRTKAEWKR